MICHAHDDESRTKQKISIYQIYINYENKSPQKHLPRLIMNRDSNINSDICITARNKHPGKFGQPRPVSWRTAHHI